MLQRYHLDSRHPGLRLWRSEIRAMASLAWPIVLTNVAQALINATDAILLGRAGASTLAAAALGFNLYTIFLIFGIGLITAASPLMAREIGARAHSVRDIRRTVRQALWSAILICLPVWLLLWNTGALLLAAGQEPALAAGAQRLVRTLQWGMLPALAYLVLRSFVAALERPFWSFVVVAAGVAFNAILNYGLIFGKLGLPALGLTGAGIGSSCAQAFMFGGMAGVVYFHPKFRRYRLFGNFLQADWPRFRHIWRIGLPIAATLTLEVAVFNTTVFLMGLIGEASIAAHMVAIQIAALSFMVPLGLGQAATVRVGLAFGRRDAVGVGRAGWSAFALAVSFMGMMAIIMLTVPGTFVGLFLDTKDPANETVVQLAVSFLFIAALFQIFDGAQAVGAGMLRGLHDTKIPMIYAAFGYWVVGLAVGVLLAFWVGWEGVGLWIGLATGLAVVSVLMLARWLRRERLNLVAWAP